jgi:5'-3' exonuclease
MTVSSLWKVLDKAGCATPVGIAEFTVNDPQHYARSQEAPNEASPWNHNLGVRPSAIREQHKATTLAVDLSIWICESLTSRAMTENHANPALHLVFSRTMKLLSLGIKLIFVLEGKRRVQTAGKRDNFRNRRSGTTFWKAGEQCHDLLTRLGIPVFRAKAEGEALCALLSQRNIVDGVISNDGDCLLFGARVVYTKFSVENLVEGSVMRYDLGNLRALIDHAGDKEASDQLTGSLSLSRFDLLSFALLTGSDLAGNGLPKVGHKKAIRFIRKCQIDNPLTTEMASIDEVKSWAVAAHVRPTNLPHQTKANEKCCSRCCHIGTKHSHEKLGCEACGTAPGEPCYAFSTEDRFRKSLREKALKVIPIFEPSQVVEAYLRPNDNQLPAQLAGKTSNQIKMDPPDLNALLQLPLILKGRSQEESREYLVRSVGRLLSRAELFRKHEESDEKELMTSYRRARERPIPHKITNSMTQNGVPSYEVKWLVNATVTDNFGEGIDGYEYSTVEPCDLIANRYPVLIKEFQQAEKERMKQGDGEKLRRLDFLQSHLFLHRDPQRPSETGDAKKVKRSKHRAGFFETKEASLPKLYASSRRNNRSKRKTGDDVGHLLRYIVRSSDITQDPLGFSPIDNSKYGLLPGTSLRGRCTPSPRKNVYKSKASLHSPEGRVFCNMGGVFIEITPIISNRRTFPPRHIFIRRSSA